MFVSHCHIDHFGSVFNHARVRSMNNPKKKVIYFVPKECVEILQKIKVMYEQLDAMKIGTDSHDENTDHHHPSLPMEFRGVEAGKSYPFPHCKSFYFRVFATDHRVPSVGYAIFERQKGGLIPELVGKSGKEIGEFVKSTGRAANTIRESLEIVYTGDTSGVSLFQNKELQKWLFDCTLFIVEMTFVCSEVSSVRSFFCCCVCPLMFYTNKHTRKYRKKQMKRNMYICVICSIV